MTHRKGDQSGDEAETQHAVRTFIARTLKVVLIDGGKAGAAARVAATAFGAWYFRDPRIAAAAFAVVLAHAYLSASGSSSGHDHDDDSPAPP